MKWSCSLDCYGVTIPALRTGNDTQRGPIDARVQECSVGLIVEKHNAPSWISGSVLFFVRTTLSTTLTAAHCQSKFQLVFGTSGDDKTMLILCVITISFRLTQFVISGSI